VDELMVVVGAMANVFEFVQSTHLGDTHLARLKPLESGLVALLRDSVMSVPEDRLGVSMNDLRAVLSETWKAAPLKSGRGNVISATYAAPVGCGCSVM
jgi:hypothetical protein